MAILILNRFSLTSTVYEKWLSARNAPLVLVSDRGRIDQLGDRADDVLQAYDEVIVVDDFARSGEAEFRAIEANDRQPITSVVALSEYDILRAARLRSHFGIPGQTPQSAMAYRDKIVMKAHFREAGLAVADCAPIHSAGELIDIRNRYGFPFVVKPRMGGGSVETRVIDGPDAFDRLLREGLSPRIEHPDFMVETFIDGAVHHIDGLVVDGDIVFTWPSSYFNDSLSFTSGVSLGSFMLDADDTLRARLQDFTRAMIAALPSPRDMSFHAEVFVCPDGRLVANEIASRTGGAGIRDTIDMSFGINLSAAAARLQCGLDPRLPGSIAGTADPRPDSYGGWVLFPPRPGVFQGAPAVAPFNWAEGYQVTAKPGTAFGAARSAMDNIASARIRGDDARTVRSRIATLDTWFQGNVSWAS